MKQFVIAGTLAGALAVGGTALAQQPPASSPTQTTPAPKAGTTAAPKTGNQAEKPARRARPKAAGGENADAGHAAPKAQPNTTENPSATTTAMPLGTVRVPKGLKADGKDLPAGTYQVRLTAEEAKPDAKGSSEVLERWVEFVQKGEVKGREVVSIVPAGEAKLVQKDTPPPSGGSKLEALKGGDYMRLWINKAGNYYLVHLPKG